MKKTLFVISFCFLCLHSALFGVGEKTISIGAASGWGTIKKFSGVTEFFRARPHSVLVLASGIAPASTGPSGDSLVDLFLSFDEGNPRRFADAKGRYLLSVSPALGSAGKPWTRAGEGAARFTGLSSGDRANAADGPLVLRPRQGALFSPENMVGDFSIEFWLYPMNLENGEQILTWTASRPDGRGGYIFQQIKCISSKNRLQWSFSDFFLPPGGRDENPGGPAQKTISFSGAVVLPRAWSHHLVRFNADLGLLEYLVDGRLEALDYATSSGREGGDVYIPVIGDDSRFVLGGRFSGIMDEFRIYSSYVENPLLTKYPLEGGRVESRTLDLGNSRSQVLKIEAFGGYSCERAEGRLPRNVYAGNDSLRFADYSELQFFIRAADTPYRWNEVPWIPVEPGTDLGTGVSGRYIQTAVNFYPSGDGETTPYLDELKIIYRTAEPPAPPTQLSAIARDGAVELSWRASPGRDLGGYVVYYGISSGEYFGDHAIIGNEIAVSPVNVGNRTSVRIEGLTNGALYYFAVASYSSGQGAPRPGVFSRETAARPLKEAPLGSVRAEVSRKVE
jgi:hypothetical protein